MRFSKSLDNLQIDFFFFLERTELIKKCSHTEKKMTMIFHHQKCYFQILGIKNLSIKS